MCTLGYELDQYFSENPLDCYHPSSLKDVPVVKALDSFEALNRISNTAGISSAKTVSDDAQISSKDIAYYGKNPVILSASKTARRQYTQSPEYYCPIGVIFDIEQLLNEKRIRNIYPFDPSDFQVSHNGKQVNSFQINRSLEGIGKYIVYFFGNLNNYQYGNSNPPAYASSEIIDQVSRMQCSDTVLETDLTISLLLENPFDFLEYARCIILPEKLLANYKFRQLAQEDTSICIKTYPLYRGRHPALYNTTVEQLYNDFINGTGDCYLKKKYHPDAPIHCHKNKKGGCYCHGI
nr:hypothetical protein [uncultured Blautia sp.]